MPTEERIKQITKIVNDLNLDDLSVSELWEQILNNNLNDLYDDIYYVVQ